MTDWLLVPREPTAEMVVAGENAFDTQLDVRIEAKYGEDPFAQYPSEETHALSARVAYRAMIDAAPKEEATWNDLPTGVTSRVAQKAYDHFQHKSELPCSASAMREAIELADRLRAQPNEDEMVEVPAKALRDLLSAVEDHWNREMAKGRKLWSGESLMAQWIIRLRNALKAGGKA